MKNQQLKNLLKLNIQVQRSQFLKNLKQQKLTMMKFNMTENSQDLISIKNTYI